MKQLPQKILTCINRWMLFVLVSFAILFLIIVANTFPNFNKISFCSWIMYLIGCLSSFAGVRYFALSELQRDYGMLVRAKSMFALGACIFSIYIAIVVVLM